MIREVTYGPKNINEAQKLQSQLMKCYGNIALTNIKLQNYQTAEDACDEMLQIDSRNAKALYLRSQIFHTKPSCKMEEQDKSYNDLVLANKYNPTSAFLRRKLIQFTKSKKAEREKYIKIFWGFFQRRSENCKRPYLKEKDSNFCRNRNERIFTVDPKQHQSSVLHLFKTFWKGSVFRNTIIIIVCRFAFLASLNQRRQKEYCGI